MIDIILAVPFGLSSKWIFDFTVHCINNGCFDWVTKIYRALYMLNVWKMCFTMDLCWWYPYSDDLRNKQHEWRLWMMIFWLYVYPHLYMSRSSSAMVVMAATFMNLKLVSGSHVCGFMCITHLVIKYNTNRLSIVYLTYKHG
jgi:hypothetical protein